MPTRHAPVRAALDQWFEQLEIAPRLVGEFEDSALMSVFAARGFGVFPVSTLGAQDLSLMPGLVELGRSDVVEEIYAIYSQRARHHPLVQKILSAAASTQGT